ncbi:hypothetical protein BDE40_3549 [Litoreibacter halocynthiae]|uniref:Lipoprotein n=1 Tax=Litoreibacter halocynthiae TaxID=1242689 RepID=A0A4R7LB57_9RHOB|nr:hypothetical protein [Litoreibacter halocynthiae]TDT72697.1 hypothetical protein BDE40_3549 [Litoreibacter halocynthiae]
MKTSVWLFGGTALLLASCGGIQSGGSEQSNPFIAELPEGVLEIVAPFQDLKAVQINPLDGCYEYRHIGKVETTFLPLRAKNGRPICTRFPETT